jgi:uncharacterized OB-fold protein
MTSPTAKSNPKIQSAALQPNEGRALKAGEVVVDAQGHSWLNASRCKDCGLSVFPPSAICPDCLSENQQPLRLSSSGKLYSYTQIHVAPPTWVVPYIIGYVDLPEGIRLFGKVDANSAEVLTVDMPVDVVVAESGGQYRYSFAPQG